MVNTVTSKDIGIGIAVGLAFVGGATLLGFGLTNQLGKYGGHKWQIITGGSILGVASIIGLASSYSLYKKSLLSSKMEDTEPNRPSLQKAQKSREISGQNQANAPSLPPTEISDQNSKNAPSPPEQSKTLDPSRGIWDQFPQGVLPREGEALKVLKEQKNLKCIFAHKDNGEEIVIYKRGNGAIITLLSSQPDSSREQYVLRNCTPITIPSDNSKAKA